MCKKNYNNIFFYENGNKNQISLNEIRKNYNKNEKDKEENESDDDDENIEKICCICKKNTAPNNLLKCDRCEAYFCHYYCAKLKNKINKWHCKYCKIDLKILKESKKKVVHFFM